VQIPFEEKELRAIFGEKYAQYSKDVPMLIPFTKRNRKDEVNLSQKSS
jgi:protein-S-isoprenylcysteine O-methyltransferase Ste14